MALSVETPLPGTRLAGTRLARTALPPSRRVVLSWLLVAAGVAVVHAQFSDGVRRVLPLVVCAGTVVAVLRVTRAGQAPLLRFWYRSPGRWPCSEVSSG